MPGLTKQDVINAVYRGFVTEEYPSAMEGKANRCYYRTADGRKCSIGMFIPDNRYAVDMEGLIVERLVARYPDVFRGVFAFSAQDELVFLSRVQWIHDWAAGENHKPGSELRDGLIQRLDVVARQFGLKSPISRRPDGAHEEMV